MREELVGKDLLADAGIIEVLETVRAELMDAYGNVADLLHVSFTYIHTHTYPHVLFTAIRQMCKILLFHYKSTHTHTHIHT